MKKYMVAVRDLDVFVFDSKDGRDEFIAAVKKQGREYAVAESDLDGKK